jgi:thioredoxin reductase (NADPH)
MPSDRSRPAHIVVIDRPRDGLPQTERLVERRFGADYAVDLANNATSGLELLRRLRTNDDDVALILADQWCPDMTGVQLLKESRSIFPDAKRVVLIAQGELNPARAEILQAAALDEIETYIVRPLIDPDEVFLRDVSRFIQEWDRENRPQPIAVRLVGSEMDLELMRLYEGMIRSGVSATFHPVDADEGQRLLKEAGLPADVRSAAFIWDGRVIENPTPNKIAAAIGAEDDPTNSAFDVVIVGAGPAGLAAAVYATSEGLSAMVIEQEALGGQASTSSMIRNYLGFPRGTTGADLTARAYWQAWFFGSQYTFGRSVVDIRPEGERRVVVLSDGTEVVGRAVILATGVAYRRIGIDRVEQMVGRGCFYGSPVTQAPGVQGHSVVVVGGGNSSAQTAIYLSRFAEKVILVARRPQLDEMSYYLVRDLEANPKVEIRTSTEVVDVAGETRLEKVVLRDASRNEDETVPASAVFILIGAEPRTEWLPASIERDARGYIATGGDVEAATVDGERRPLPYETSMAGVFAAGDVRLGGMKRVAAAVGEGSSVVRHIHEYLALVREGAELQAAKEKAQPD